MAATCATCAPGPARPLCCSTWVRAQLEYFAPLLRDLNTARFAVIPPTYPGTASRERPPGAAASGVGRAVAGTCLRLKSRQRSRNLLTDPDSE